jgi:hypothetical protein
VDLPTPGSPASSTTEPGTSPPPSTRSSSATPVVRRGLEPASISRSERGLPATGAGSACSSRRTRVGAAATSSTRLDQEPHSGQRPSHRGCCAPHSVQANTDLSRPTAPILAVAAAADAAATRQPRIDARLTDGPGPS